MEVNINIRINDEVAEEHKDRVLESCIEKVKYDIESGCNQGELIVEFEDGQDAKAVMKNVLKACKKVEPDCEIEL